MGIRSTNPVNRKKKLFRQIAQQRVLPQIVTINLFFIRPFSGACAKISRPETGLVRAACVRAGRSRIPKHN